MAVYWGKDFGIRAVVLGGLFLVAGVVLSVACSLTLIPVSPPGPSQCLEYGFGLWNWAMVLIGIGLIVVGLVSAMTGRESQEESEPLLE
jgi:hypothetical protein